MNLEKGNTFRNNRHEKGLFIYLFISDEIVLIDWKREKKKKSTLKT